MSNTLSQTPTATIAVRFQKIGKLYHFDCHEFPDVRPADFVVCETARGRQLGQVMGYVHPQSQDSERRKMLRIATPRELLMKQYWEGRQVEALINCREKAAHLGGFEGCKFIEAEYNYDGSYLTILFSAENTTDRINTYRIRTVLGNLYPKTKIELRQIGARDVAKALGGMGACGIPRCCSTFLTDFSPVSIKMAKAQGISLNPSEITGMCGRLRCCLIYEYEQYVQARTELPKKNKEVRTPHGDGKVLDVHPLQDAVTVLVGDMRHLVTRDQLEPLDELSALRKKADAGCSKNESGGCDCGAKSAKPTDSSEAEDVDTVLMDYFRSSQGHSATDEVDESDT
jgi:cell fate regulator YaaT (PSP1 superfamily)